MALPLRSRPRCSLYKILKYMGLYEILPPGAGQNRAKLRKDIEEYHVAYAIDFDDTDIDNFIARRPGGLAFDREKKLCLFLYNTQEQWTRMKTGQRRMSRSKRNILLHLGIINHPSNREKSGWKASQTNFTTGVRGSLQISDETGVAWGKE